MSHLLRFSLRFAAVVLWVLVGFVLLLGFYMWAGPRPRERLNRWWSCWMLRCCGVRVRVVGLPPPEGAALLIANHVSWLDVYVLSCVRATIFVAKSELRTWPLLGWLVAGVGTIFIERGNRRAIQQVSADMQERFDQGLLVGLFPEGTTSDGLDLLPFHAGLFESALRTGVAVQPVALRYLHKGQRSDFAAYVGEQTLMGNAWQVLGDGGVDVDVVYLPLVSTTDGGPAAESRHTLAAAVFDAIRAEVLPL